MSPFINWINAEYSLRKTIPWYFFQVSVLIIYGTCIWFKTAPGFLFFQKC